MNIEKIRKLGFGLLVMFVLLTLVFTMTASKSGDVAPAGSIDFIINDLENYNAKLTVEENSPNYTFSQQQAIANLRTQINLEIVRLRELRDLLRETENISMSEAGAKRLDSVLQNLKSNADSAPVQVTAVYEKLQVAIYPNYKDFEIDFTATPDILEKIKKQNEVTDDIAVIASQLNPGVAIEDLPLGIRALINGNLVLVSEKSNNAYIEVKDVCAFDNTQNCISAINKFVQTVENSNNFEKALITAQTFDNITKGAIDAAVTFNQ